MRHWRRGYVLLPVLLLLSLVAAASYLTQREAQLLTQSVQGSVDYDKARAAAEAGLNHLVHSAHLKGCSGDYPTASTPLTASDFDGASYSAYASAKSGSPVDITAVGGYGQARVSVSRKAVVIHNSGAQNMVLQPDGNGKDTTTDYSIFSQAGSTALNLAPETSQALLEFDLSAIPNGSHVSAAQLSLRIIDKQGSGLVDLHRIQSYWAEGATSLFRSFLTAWVQQVGDAHAVPVASSPVQGMGWLSWSVTELVDGWVKGRWPNHGMVLRANTLKSLSLASSDYGTASLRPRLTIKAHAPCGSTLPNSTQTLDPIADTTIYEAAMSFNDGGTDTLKLADTNTSTKGDAKALLRFDTSTLSPDAPIKKATLRLTFAGATDQKPTSADVDIVLRVNWQDWNESHATWVKRTADSYWERWGASLSNPDEASLARTVKLPKGSSANSVLEIDAKEWVTAWAQSPASNMGLLMQLAQENTIGFTFFSRESLSAPPELVIEY
ncbi:MAG: hypothetical protein C4K60_03935 [Ideonella sp. MAG2]|nr:MAG: hypothetical protein C4K60_03935 [Ideonella sp. MAG2]